MIVRANRRNFILSAFQRRLFLVLHCAMWNDASRTSESSARIFKDSLSHVVSLSVERIWMKLSIGSRSKLLTQDGKARSLEDKSSLWKVKSSLSGECREKLKRRESIRQRFVTETILISSYENILSRPFLQRSH